MRHLSYPLLTKDTTPLEPHRRWLFRVYQQGLKGYVIGCSLLSFGLNASLGLAHRGQQSTGIQTDAGPKSQLRDGQTILLLNSPDVDPQTQSIRLQQELPRGFRTSEDPFPKTLPNGLPVPPRTGLEELRISGSAQFSAPELEKILERLSGKKLLFIDLRQEPHGFINGKIAISWYGKNNALNASKRLPEIETDEWERLSRLKQPHPISLTYWFSKKDPHSPPSSPLPILVQNAVSEQMLIQSYGHAYFRIPAPDHLRPRDQDVDRFVRKFKQLSADTWIHFHCKAGEGRTTSFMAMTDMLKNAKRVSFEDILERQKLLGGLDLKDQSRVIPSKKLSSQQRLEFLKKFYDYAQTQGPLYQKSWSEWIKSQTKTSGHKKAQSPSPY